MLDQNDRQPFVILFEARTGSSYLTRSLRTSGQVKMHGERLTDLKRIGSEAQLKFVNYILNQPLTLDEKAVGFKVKASDVLDMPGFRQLMHNPTAMPSGMNRRMSFLQGHSPYKPTKIIHLQRRNRVKIVVSWFNQRRLLEERGDANLFKKEDLGAITIDPAEFDQVLKQREQVDKKLADFVGSIDCPTLDLYYEGLLADEAAFFAKVCTFLGVDPIVPEQKKVFKATKDDLRQAIANFDDLYERYATTPYAAMFTEAG